MVSGPNYWTGILASGQGPECNLGTELHPDCHCLCGGVEMQWESGNLVWFEATRVKVGRLETSSRDEIYSRREDEEAAELVPRQMPTHLITKLPGSSQKFRYRHWESSPISNKSFHLVSVCVGIREGHGAGWKRWARSRCISSYRCNSSTLLWLRTRERKVGLVNL